MERGGVNGISCVGRKRIDVWAWAVGLWEHPTICARDGSARRKWWGKLESRRARPPAQRQTKNLNPPHPSPPPPHHLPTPRRNPPFPIPPAPNPSSSPPDRTLPPSPAAVSAMPDLP
ncbi:hypothetical protein SETIT_3G115500v2 [Setaria italica]|uniref:Uncharacterized protein n=1 Tax=Setaria italica TaxID=4555 RepID=A0A368QFV6_SETIT|nr:hypothetical protein SETIT_3G115500v2 [Setaria italica]